MIQDIYHKTISSHLNANSRTRNDELEETPDSLRNLVYLTADQVVP